MIRDKRTWISYALREFRLDRILHFESPSGLHDFKIYEKTTELDELSDIDTSCIYLIITQYFLIYPIF